MANQKLDNLLNLALNATEEEIEKSPSLETGYDVQSGRWEVIVKYVGDIEYLKEYGIEVVELMNGYAILNLQENQINNLTELNEIIFVEKPKRLYFALYNSRSEICVNVLQTGYIAEEMGELFGNGTIVAVIDSGIDYTHPDFINEDGTSRILSIWDQTISGNPPEGYTLGSEYTNEQINEALRSITSTNRRQAFEIVPSQDFSGHGTVVASIAAGNGRESFGRYRGVAPQADIIAVKLGNPRPDSFPKTSELMQGINYVISKAVELKKPVAVNLSFGNTYGSHDGTSLLETYIDEISDVWQSVFSVGMGNEGAAAGHVAGRINQGETVRIELAVGNYETEFSIQLWKEYMDKMEVYLISPGGQQYGPFTDSIGTQRYQSEMTQILVYYGEPAPYSQAQEIYIDLIPIGNYVESGVWNIVLTGERIVEGIYDMWLPSAVALSPQTRFLQPSKQTTLTIPSTASKVISVGAYNALNFGYADFSGRGYIRGDNIIKPDIVAPGVDITAAKAGGGYASFTGTSMATPFVTGAAALMMEWGIGRRNDVFLYGEKVKAYLKSGARQLPGFYSPNELTGYGALCVSDSLPI